MAPRALRAFPKNAPVGIMKCRHRQSNKNLRRFSDLTDRSQGATRLVATSLSLLVSLVESMASARAANDHPHIAATFALDPFAARGLADHCGRERNERPDVGRSMRRTRTAQIALAVGWLGIEPDVASADEDRDHPWNVDGPGSPARRPASASSSLFAIERVSHRQLAHPVLEKHSDPIDRTWRAL